MTLNHFPKSRWPRPMSVCLWCLCIGVFVVNSGSQRPILDSGTGGSNCDLDTKFRDATFGNTGTWLYPALELPYFHYLSGLVGSQLKSALIDRYPGPDLVITKARANSLHRKVPAQEFVGWSWERAKNERVRSSGFWTKRKCRRCGSFGKVKIGQPQKALALADTLVAFTAGPSHALCERLAGNAGTWPGP